MYNRRNLLKLASGTIAAAAATSILPSTASANSRSSTYFNVSDYDNGTGDTVAIQAAIKAAFDSGGGVVYMPAGTYQVTQIILQKNVTLLGEGMGTLIRQENTVDTEVIRTENADSYPVSVQSLRIIGSSAGGSNAHGIRLSSKSNGNGFTIPDGEHLISDVFIAKVGGSGVHIDEDCRGSSIRGTWVKSCGVGFRIEGSDSTIAECVARDSDAAGFSIAAGNTRLVNCKSYFNKAGGFVTSSSRSAFFACEAQDNWNFGFAISANYSTMTGCMTDSNQYYGVWLNSSTGYLAGINITGVTAIGRNTQQAGKPWTGQRYGIGVVNTRLRDSVIAGLARDNCDDNYLVKNSILENVNTSTLVEGRLAGFC